jgi:hypothetical protein
MARFKYLGEPPRPNIVKVQGPVLGFRFHMQDGSLSELLAPDPAVGFLTGQDLGIDITDPRVLRHLRNDPRFEELTHG